VTSHVKGYPFEVPLPETGMIKGAILADHVKSLSWQARRSRFADVATESVLEQVLAKIDALLASAN
jgi:mRNA interferase MazF